MLRGPEKYEKKNSIWNPDRNAHLDLSRLQKPNASYNTRYYSHTTLYKQSKYIANFCKCCHIYYKWKQIEVIKAVFLSEALALLNFK